MKFLLMAFFPLLSFAQTTGIATPWDTAPMVAALSTAGGPVETDSGSVDSEGMGGEGRSGRLRRAVEGRGG